jgi:predicted  nucleic acid-binding Zn-ribbon protein
MNTVTAVKERVADLSSLLEAGRHEVSRLHGERRDLLRQVEDARNEASASREELLRERRQREDFDQQQMATIRDLDTCRRELVQALRAAKAQLASTERRLTELTREVERAEEERDAARCELGEATTALGDIRDQLRVTLEVFPESPRNDTYDSA